MNKKIMLFSNTSWYLFNFRDSTIEKLINNGFDVFCVAPRDAYSSRLEELGAKFIELDLDGKSTKITSELRTITKVFKIIQDIKPDCVLNFTIKLNIYSGICCFIQRIPFINNVSGLGTAFIHKGLSFKFAKILYGLINKKSHWVFFQNSDDRDHLLEIGSCRSENSSVLPGSGVDLNKFSYTPKLKEKSKTRFLMIARMISDKGTNEFVSAARILKDKYPSSEFTLVGELYPSNKTAIPRDIVDTWLEDDRISVYGHSDNIIDLIRESDIFVLPSYREGLPRTVIEAASIGRPAIVTDVPGCRQAVINGVSGWYCEAQSVDSLVSTMEKVHHLDNDEIRLFGDRARKNVEEVFSVDIVIEQYMQKIKSSF